MSQDAGFENISIDLIYGSRFQDLREWQGTLETAVALQTQHISAYNLTIEKKTVLGVRHQKGLEPEIDEGLSKDQFILMTDFLRSEGWLHYEISNFARPGSFAKHNSNYWLGETYLGVGPSAHSYDGHTRQWNVRSNPQYINALESGSRFFEIEELSAEQRYNEYVLTRLRTTWGCDIKDICKNFGTKANDHFLAEARRKKEFLVESDGIFTLNTLGKLRADAISSDFFIV
jgi:oxygen-independent coproporphyrinogen III oxidase